MKKLFLLLTLALLSNQAYAQQPEAAQKLIDEGVDLHDKGEYDRAIASYDQALSLDKDNLTALTEKSLSLNAQNKFEQAVATCRLALEKYPSSPKTQAVYLCYGNALDGLHKQTEAIEMYDQGIAKYPDFYQLHFNKGITQVGLNQVDGAIASLQRAISLNPKHASSHNALGRILKFRQACVPAVMALCRLLVLEPTSSRAKEDLESIQKMMAGDVQKTGRNAITINLDPSALPDTTAAGKAKENNFAMTQMIMTMDAALDFDKKFKKLTPVEQFARHMGTVCASLQESRKDNSGFYWSYYAPYFIEMREKGLLETFSYLAFASSDDAKVNKWLEAHTAELTTFYDWSKGFKWQKS
jgi:tetratricopeptide (TPR) repeat protein